MTFANGGRYQGQFQNDEFHGQGVFFYTDGTKEEGIWEKGRLKIPKIFSLKLIIDPKYEQNRKVMTLVDLTRKKGRGT